MYPWILKVTFIVLVKGKIRLDEYNKKKINVFELHLNAIVVSTTISEDLLIEILKKIVFIS